MKNKPHGLKGKPKSDEHKKAIAKALKGKPKSDEHKKALSEKVRTEEHNKNLKNSLNKKEVKEKRCKTMILRFGVPHAANIPENNLFRVEYWLKKGMNLLEAKTKISNLQSGFSKLVKNVVSRFQIKYWLDRGYTEKEAKINISKIQSYNASFSNANVSKGETAYLDKIQELINFKIERNVLLCEKFLVDGFIEKLNIVIEYFGDFWHMHESLFSPNDIHKVTGWKASSKWAEDNGRIKYLQKAGYKVFVVWEHESKDEEKMDYIRKEILNASN